MSNSASASNALSRRLPVVRLSVTLGLAMAALFTAAWLATQLPMGRTDLFVSLFTSAAPSSTDGLAEGALWAAFTGVAAGALISAIYNALRFLGRD